MARQYPVVLALVLVSAFGKTTTNCGKTGAKFTDLNNEGFRLLGKGEFSLAQECFHAAMGWYLTSLERKAPPVITQGNIQQVLGFQAMLKAQGVTRPNSKSAPKSWNWNWAKTSEEEIDNGPKHAELVKTIEVTDEQLQLVPVASARVLDEYAEMLKPQRQQLNELFGEYLI